MNFTGSFLLNAFEGDDNRRPMTRSIRRIGTREYAIFLNVSDEGTTAAVHAVTGRNGNSPIVDKDALALSECFPCTDIAKCEWVIDSLEFDGVTLTRFAVTEQFTNPNDNGYRLAMPEKIARIRYGKRVSKSEDAPAPGTGTTGF